MAAKRTKGAARRGGRTSVNLTVVLLSVLLLISLVLALASLFLAERWGGYNEKYLLNATDQQRLVQQAEKAAVSAAQSEELAFPRLRSVRDDFQTSLDELTQGAPDKGLPPSPPEFAELLRNTETAWLALSEGLDRILANEESILAVRDLVAATGALLPELSESMERVVELMVERQQPQRRILAAARQLTLIQRMSASLGDFLIGGSASARAIDQFSADAEQFGIVLDGLLGGDLTLDLSREDDPEVREALADTSQLFSTMRVSADELLSLVRTVLPGLEGVDQMSASGDRIERTLDDLIQAYRTSPGRLKLGPVTVGPATVLLFGASALVFLVLLVVQLLIDARRREAESKAQNDANQQAILRLLDEMGDLADGDLTVEATVTEDITGAIADSVNYAVDALRALVATINDTAEQVTSSAQDTRTTTMQLASASELQERQISKATGAIKSLTQDIDEVASNASESAEVASRSVEVASRGAQTVRDTIQGMDAIREQIQETSKRIKRLGESSQEIGEIVELIDDIADQTNILALNAAMQAAMAGEAGRGFAVVADEVQRLAERSRDATKQIEEESILIRLRNMGSVLCGC
ncbi:MAG: methyl-accepting chemotaxis protein [Pseudomonadota bacterium]|nr:methyl-accepting chemotaxis protein [Pseudomonadota bacterium]